MDAVKKDASVGEYDPRTGLTHVTRQRGRLLFNMGASARKQRQQQQPEHQQEQSAHSSAPLRVVNLDAQPELPSTTSVTSSLATGTFTGLSLYPEEALYLVQRGALAVFLITEGRHREESGGLLDAAAFVALLVQHQRVSLACLEAYAFLKGEKLHPRRCLETSHHDERAGAWGQRRAPRHVRGGAGPLSVAFDVWKSVVAPSLPPDDAAATPAAPSTTAEPPTQPRPVTASKPVKRLQLVFRVLVSRFDDPPPPPKALRASLLASHTEHPGVPVKLAIVSRDRSVLLLELSALAEGATSPSSRP